VGDWWSKNGTNVFLEKDQIGVDLVKYCLLAGLTFCRLKNWWCCNSIILIKNWLDYRTIIQKLAVPVAV
jgi:hypothetical protein